MKTLEGLFKCLPLATSIPPTPEELLKLIAAVYTERKRRPSDNMSNAEAGICAKLRNRAHFPLKKAPNEPKRGQGCQRCCECTHG